MASVIIITGACGAGKTTTATKVAEALNCKHLQGDIVKEELFPGLVNIVEHPEKLVTVNAELLKASTDGIRIW